MFYKSGINFHDDLGDVPQTNKTFNISYLQISNYCKECTKKEIDETRKIITPEHFINNESKRDDTEVVSGNRKYFSNIFSCPDWNKKVIPDHELFVDCPCRLMVATKSWVVIDNVAITVKNQKLLKLNLVTTSEAWQTCYDRHDSFLLSNLPKMFN